MCHICYFLSEKYISGAWKRRFGRPQEEGASAQPEGRLGVGVIASHSGVRQLRERLAAVSSASTSRHPILPIPRRRTAGDGVRDGVVLLLDPMQIQWGLRLSGFKSVSSCCAKCLATACGRKKARTRRAFWDAEVVKLQAAAFASVDKA